MLESLAAGLLNRILGSYVENFDPKQLNIGIWGGDVKLKNLRLKRDSLDKFQLPIDIGFGHLGQLTLQIPWSNLKSKAVKIIVEDVYLLASPVADQSYNAEEEAEKEFRVKRERLESYEFVNNSRPKSSSSMNEEENAKNESFTESLITKIVDNVQVTIKNIHLRYEDSSVFTDNPYSFGFTLEELSAVSADESWIPNFITGVALTTRKLLTLKSLSVYWNTDAHSISSMDPDELLAMFQQIIERNSKVTVSDSEMQYLLRPVSGTGHIVVNKAGPTASVPHIKSKLFFDEFGLDLDQDQYRDMLWTATKLHWYAKTHQYRKLRPTVAVSKAPREWFVFAAQSVYKEIHEKNYKWSWDYFKTRRDQRKAYIALWKDKVKKGEKPLSPGQQNELDTLERALSFDDIKFFRSLARREYRKENVASAASAVKSETAAATGWFSSWWQGGKQEDQSDDIQMTDEQRKELYDAIEYDEQQALMESLDVPKEFVKYELNSSLKKGSFGIRTKKGLPNLGEIVFEGCDMQVYQRTDSILGRFQLQEFKVEDGAEDTLYKHIVSVKPLHSHIHSDVEEQGSSPFFQFSFEQNPLDGSADSAICARLRSMTIFHNYKFVEEIIKFFTPPKIHIDTIGMIMNAAENKIGDFTQQTRIGLEYALEEHKTLNCQVDLQSPLIILPLDPSSWDSPVAVMDAGHLSIRSELADKDLIDEVKSRSSQQYNEKDWERLNTLMYDKFDLRLQDAQVLIGPDVKSTIEQLHSESESSATILDKFSMELLLQVSILPQAFNLPKMKVSGDVPRFSAGLNDLQYKILMQLIDTVIPDFESDEQSPAHSSAKVEELSLDAASVAEEAPVSQAALNQHIFEFDFNVDSIKLSLSRCTNAKTMASDLLIDVVGDNLALNFVKKEQEMNVNLLLSAIDVVDHIEKSGPAEFQKILSSKNFAAEDKIVNDDDLFKLQFNRRLRMALHEGKSIEVWDQDCDLQIADVKVVVSRKSLLSLLNFSINTFTEPNPKEVPADELRHNDAEDAYAAPQKMNVSVKMQSIIIVLNDDGIKLATLKLSQGDVKVLMLQEKMHVQTKLGALTLFDEVNEAMSRESVLRSLITMQGDEFAELTYETFDKATNDLPYTSMVKMRTGSMVINFVEAPFGKIYGFLMKFQRMKYVYDRAREAALNQVNSIDVSDSMYFDIAIRAPTVVFPKLVNVEHSLYDSVTMQLGEIYASNEFVDDRNLISAGIRDTGLSSCFHFGQEDEWTEQTLTMIENLGVDFHIDLCENHKGTRPTIIAKGNTKAEEMKFTDLQCAYLMHMATILPGVFVVSDPAGDESDLEAEAINANYLLELDAPASVAQTPTPAPQDVDQEHCNLDFNFTLPQLSLSLYHDTAGVTDLNGKQLCKLSLNETGLKFSMKENGNFKSELHVMSFTVQDTRLMKDNHFTEIIPQISNDEHQFMASGYSDGPAENRNIFLNLTVDSPTVIVAVDYLFALKDFCDVVLATGKAQQSIAHQMGTESSDSDSSVSSDPTVTDTPSNVAFSVNVVECSVILLANPSSADSEAIVFKIGQFLVSSQQIISVSANNTGMFLCRMNNSDRLRIIDDFSSSLVIDSRDSDESKFLTNIKASVEPMLMRLSLRDIRLALSIFNKASALYGEATSPAQEEAHDLTTVTEDLKRRLSQYAPTIISALSRTSRGSHRRSGTARVVVKGEDLMADIGGFRAVLIGDVHELPILDMLVDPFSVTAKNWSTDLEADISLQSQVKIFNYATSSWEPLIEPWPVSIHAQRMAQKHSSISVDVVSRKLAEVTVSSNSIALLSQVASLLSEEVELKPRGEDSPYRIKNQTGFAVDVWIEEGENPRSENAKVEKVRIENGQEIPWQFEDWRTVRESLDVDSERGFIAVSLVDSPYEDITRIYLKGEGESVFMLSPKMANHHNRMSCSIKLREDKVKEVVLKSTVMMENLTHAALCVGLCRVGETTPDETLTVEAGDFFSLPVDRVFQDSLVIKPVTATPFGWSTSTVKWQDLLTRSVSLKCPSEQDGKTNFHFQVSAEYNKEEPLTRVYPHMSIVISSPVEIENLLPFDMSFRIYDKTARKEWKQNLPHGTSSPVHVVRLEHFLLLSVSPQCPGYDQSEFAIINAISGSGFKPETRLLLRREDGQRLFLKIHYTRAQDRGAGVKISIYSPYVIQNRTGQDLYVCEKGNTLQSTVLREERDAVTAARKKLPDMFSFERDNDRSSRATLKLGSQSGYSRPIGLDAIGQSYDVSVPASMKTLERNVGVHVTEGEGKYKLCKVITVAPRYVLLSKLSQTVEFRETEGESKTLDSGQLKPIYNLRRGAPKQLQMRFQEADWSSPFNFKDIGEIFLKLWRQDGSQFLAKIDIVIENATLFISIDSAHNRWPFSVRNFSDTEFLFYQSNPNVDENGSLVNESSFRPIYYKVPPKSVMPYSWDYPAGVLKELIIRSHGKERHIQISEIGNLRPMRLPAVPKEQLAPAIVDLNVAADGPTQTLVISNYDPSTSLYQLKKTSSSSVNASSTTQLDQFESIEKDENYYSKIVVRLEGMGISLINTRLQELCYITLRGLELRYNESEVYQNLSMKLKWIQVDNQLYGSVFPIVIYPTVLPHSSKEMNNHPAFSASVSRVKDESHGVLFIKYATILLQEMSIEIDEDFLFALLDFSKVPGASWNQHVESKLCDDNIDIPQPLQDGTDNNVYFEALHLQPMQMNLSFMRTERINAEDRTDAQNAFMFFLNILTMAIGNINDAPVRLNALLIENVHVPLPMLVQSIQTHYGQAFLYQVHKILGSADFLGDPVGLFNNISSGFMDIFYEPYQGFIMNDRPQELGIGIAKGGLSFLKKSVFGISDSVAKFTGSMAKGLTVATLDKDFQEKRRLNQKRNRPNHAVYGFASGATSFIDGISSGITGVANAPAEAVRTGGPQDFFKGLGKGIIGLPTKTAIGIFDLATNVSEGIRNTTTVFDSAGLDKVRLPRHISHDKCVRTYSEREAQGQFWLKNCNGGQFFSEEYLAHIVLPGGELCVIVSFRRIILCSIPNLTANWDVKFDRIQAISLEKTGIKIIVKGTKNEGNFVPIPDAQSRKFLYTKIGVAVEQFNKHCQVVL